MDSFSPRVLSLAMKSLLAALVIASATAAPEQAPAQGAVKSVHNDWQVRCDTILQFEGKQIVVPPHF